VTGSAQCEAAAEAGDPTGSSRRARASRT
jgi:hypothetical protein